LSATYQLNAEWSGWLEIVIGVQDVDTAAAPLLEHFGWRTLYRGKFDTHQKQAWSLPESETVQEHVIHVAETYGGFIRFVSFDDANPQRVRPEDAMPWDAGGIWLVNTRVRNLESESAKLHEQGYPTPRGITAFDWDFLSVKEVIHKGPDGMCLSVLEQVKPAIDPPEAYPIMSRAFNAAIACKEHHVSRDFYVNKLGFKPWVETVWDKTNPGMGLIAPSRTFEKMTKMYASNVNPEGNNFGSIELMTYEGDFDIKDYTKRAAPPALGNLMLRFYVENLDEKLADFKANGAEPLSGCNEYTLAPFGAIRSAIIESPEGVWLEFFEKVA